MKLEREARRSDPLGRYYTDSLVGERLVNEMGLPTPKTVIDLGAGAGTLSHEAYKLWKTTSFVTVDIDIRARSSQLASIHGKNFKHYVGDALELELPGRLGLKEGVDAAVCNPPYLRPEWRKHFGEILEDAGLGRVAPKSGDISAGVLFIAQNLRLLTDGGKLGLILPDGVIAGERYQLFRNVLFRTHRIEKIVELPRRAFKNTDAKAHIVVLSKNVSSDEYIPVTRLNGDGSLARVIVAPAEDFPKRLDYSYLEGQKKYSGSTRVGDIAQALYRGATSSAQKRLSQVPVFHTTDFRPGMVSMPPSFYLTEEQEHAYSGPVALPGDILLARVGRNLSEKVCLVEGPGKVAISDCIIVLRVNTEYAADLLHFLTSKRGRASLEAMTKGVGAKFLTVKAIREIGYKL